MVVLHVMEALGGGTARHLVDVVRFAHGVDHLVAVPRRRVGAFSDDAAAEQLRAAGADVRFVEMRPRPPHPRNVSALASLARLVGSVRPDVVHGHSSVGGALGRVAAMRHRPRLVYTANALSPSRAALAVERALGRLTDRFIAVSVSEGEEVVRLGVVPRERLVVIPNGIDPEETPVAPFSLRTRLGLDAGTPLVGTVSRLVPQKAPEIFVAACAVVAVADPTARFVLIGSGPLRPGVEAAIDKGGLRGRLRVVDDVSDAAGLVGELDVFVSTARFEGGPYSPLDAMREATPVVLTAATGNVDVVIDGESGYLAPVDDAGAVAAHVLRLLAEPRLRRRVGAAGRARLVREFDVRDMGRSLSRLYTDLSPR
ncbi:MAG: hypothetical protein QOE92_2317 [Chloroflexota bacterium]|nr:hypothetical protein [Chloroflexota bacterium]